MILIASCLITVLFIALVAILYVSATKPYGIEDLSFLDINSSTIRVENSYLKDEVIALCHVGIQDTYELYRIGIILFEDPSKHFRKEFCTFVGDFNCRKIFVCFDNCCMVLPYNKLLHMDLLYMGFKREYIPLSEYFWLCEDATYLNPYIFDINRDVENRFRLLYNFSLNSFHTMNEKIDFCGSGQFFESLLEHKDLPF